MTRITINEIKSDPWFKKGYKEIKYSPIDDNLKEEDKKLLDLNAFDILSFSSGLDLLGLFDDSHSAVRDVERLTVTETPDKVIEKVEVVVKGEKKNIVRLRRKKEFGVELEGQNGKFIIGLEFYRLSDNLAVVEAKRISGDAIGFTELWKKKIRPVILPQKEQQVLGN